MMRDEDLNEGKIIELSRVTTDMDDDEESNGSAESGFSNDDGMDNPIQGVAERGEVTLQAIEMDLEYVMNLQKQRRRAVIAMVLLLIAGMYAGVFLRGKSYQSKHSPPSSEETPMANGVQGEEEMDDEGRLIKFFVDNLDGVEGNTGEFVVRTRPSWAPIGVQRFEELTEKKFWDGCSIFRVLPHFVSQFGINGDPKIQKKWRDESIIDDPVLTSNKRGTVTFATSGENTRTTQIFINTAGNKRLDKDGFSPIGEVVEGMEDTVDRFFSGYGEGGPKGKGPDQSKIQKQGDAYLKEKFPKLTFFTKAEFID